jgi:uncharacterized protein (DUF433 family)
MGQVRLDREEADLLESYEADEWASVDDLETEAARYQEYARVTFKKDSWVNIRISAKDLERIQKMERLITCDDEILSGTPVFKNTRVPIKNLIDYLETGDNFDEFLDDFPSVSREQVIQTLELAKEMLLSQAYANSYR